ncbi:MAG: hypothetical protein K8T26_04515 [Lentisphaerae bacterium]|nr:hypothetical protein [Lentisphaerota bacterium]
MKAPAYFVALLLSLACVVLSVVLILVARKNQALQVTLQRQQESLSSGVLGTQGQQISGSVLQDLGNAAAVNPAIRELLAKYGYRVRSAQTPAAAADAVSQAASGNAKGNETDSAPAAKTAVPAPAARKGIP